MEALRTRGSGLLRAGALAALLAAFLGLPLAQTAHAADLGFNVSGGSAGVDYTYDAGVLTVVGEAPLAVSLAGDATADRIVVDPGEGRTARLTLDGVRIDVISLGEAAFLVESGGLDLVLAGDSSLKSGGGHAGLENGVRPLCISGDGRLFAQGPGAGIGGGDGDGSNITIKSGEVVANGGCAGIGGGYDGSGTYITIEGGTIVANGGCAGIGGGYDGDGANITISGGVVVATGSMYAAGIGGSFNGNGSYIAITGGTVTATGGEFAAGIGSGRGLGNGSDITISGGMVTATGGFGGAGIGGGDCNGEANCANGTNIAITGGTVIATGGECAAGIGGGYSWSGHGSGGVGSGIAISDGKVTAVGGPYGAGIGGGCDSDGFHIAITGGDVAATGGDEGSGIGGAADGNGLGITVSGGTVAATGGIYAAGIGGGSGLDANLDPGIGGIGSGIAIEGGFVSAVPGENAQAIGGGSGAAEREDPSLTGGFFADAARDWAGNRVYGVAPARGFAAAENRDAATSAAYPVRVLPMAALELAADARLSYDGAAPAASEVVEAARYGETDALGSVAFEHRAAGGTSWEPGLPSAAGTYRVRAALPEKEVGGALYAAATAEGGLVIAPAAFSYRVDDREVIVGSRLSDVAVPAAAAGVNGEAVEGSLTWYADAARSAPLLGDWEFSGEAGAAATLYWRFAPDASEVNYAPEPVSGQTTFTLVARPAGGASAPKPLPGTGDPLGPAALAALASAAAAGAALRRARRR
ncbi:hypothetical protein [Arabiibacter massiliensis]|uniref:hypothetical protein n=1 Tax=Arabiibacter massiliensis TaxID=1870985 RepID=UPI0009BB285B|nr:hypothetical protein [Arabiibacter massiliensis]